MKFTSPEFFSPVFPNPYRSENITPSTTEILYGYKPESTRFRAVNHYLLIARYYIHLARNKSENPRLDVFIVLLGIKIQCERKIAGGPLCAFLTCVVTCVCFFLLLVFFLLNTFLLLLLTIVFSLAVFIVGFLKCFYFLFLLIT